MAETRYGIRVDEHSLHTDGAGAGEYRGGSGAVRVYRSMNENQTLQHLLVEINGRYGVQLVEKTVL